MILLDAINIVLTHGAGVRPVSSESDPTGGATTFIERVRQNVLKGGYPANIEQMDLVRDVNNEIKVPPDVLSVLLRTPYIVRGGKIWNRKDRTHVLTVDFPNTTVNLDIAFDDLDQSVQDFIAWSAAAEFAASKRGGNSERAMYCRDQANTKEVELSLEYPAEIIQHENPQYEPDSGRSFLWQSI